MYARKCNYASRTTIVRIFQPVFRPLDGNNESVAHDICANTFIGCKVGGDTG